MQFVSDSEQSEYELTINRIDEENRKKTILTEQLHRKECEILIEKLAAAQIEDNVKISHVTCRIFYQYADLINVFYGKIQHYNNKIDILNQHQENGKYCLINVNLNRNLYDKLMKISGANYMINISIGNNQHSYNRTIKLPTAAVEQNREIYEIFVIDENCYDFHVETVLYCFSESASMIALPLHSVLVDISYFFQSLPQTKIVDLSLNETVEHIGKLYCTKIAENSQKTIRYKFVSDINESQRFYHLLLQNSYHNFNITHLSQLSKINHFKLMVNNQIISVDYNSNNDINNEEKDTGKSMVEIQGDPVIVNLIRKFLLKVNEMNPENLIMSLYSSRHYLNNSEKNKIKLQALIRKYDKVKISEELHDFCDLHQDLRRFWMKEESSKDDLADDEEEEFSLSMSPEF